MSASHATVFTTGRRGTILGRSAWVCSLRAEIAALARHSITVLITGPSGTGKELVARAVHQMSSRTAGPFVPVDCTTITGSLFASQLFGHRRGAFTGADYEALGCFRAAHGGTVFLDEIGELEPEFQAKLLRVLEEKTVVPVGAFEGIPVDVRIIAATNRDLRQEVSRGRFREDLYFRLAAATVETLPLRDRPDDIPDLAAHFLERMAGEAGLPRKGLSPAALRVLQAFDWPGNIRQLRHVIEQAMITCGGPTIEPDAIGHLLEKMRLPQVGTCRGYAGQRPEGSGVDIPGLHEPGMDQLGPDAWTTLAEMEKTHIERALWRTAFNRSAAARQLGITRQALMRKVKKHGIPSNPSLSVPPPRRPNASLI